MSAEGEAEVWIFRITIKSLFTVLRCNTSAVALVSTVTVRNLQLGRTIRYVSSTLAARGM